MNIAAPFPSSAPDFPQSNWLPGTSVEARTGTLWATKQVAFDLGTVANHEMPERGGHDS